jgi:predicted transcriptional regulator
MTTITLTLTEEQRSKLDEIARRSGVTVEDVAQIGLQDWLGRERAELDAAAEYLLKKNAELYRRLA